jgi:hypothetical protein
MGASPIVITSLAPADLLYLINSLAVANLPFVIDLLALT